MILRQSFFALTSFFLVSPLLLASSEQHNDNQRLSAPPESAVVEEYYGTKVTDRFHSLEKLENPQVQQWIKQQSSSAKSILQGIPGRSSLVEKMHDFDGRKASKVYNLSITDNNRYFYLKETPTDETGKLFFRDGFKGKETLLFDARAFFSGSGKEYVISGVSASEDGSKLTISVSANGSEDSIVLIMDVGSKKLYPERIDRCRFASPSWLRDGKSFLYNRMQPLTHAGQNPQYDSKTFLHRAGTDPSSDREIFSNTTNPELHIKSEDVPSVDYDKKSGYLFAVVSNVDPRVTVYYAPAKMLSEKKIVWKQLFAPENEVHDFAVTKNDLYIYTPKNAPHFKVVKTSLKNPDFAHAATVIDEDSKAMLTSFALTRDALYYTQSRNGVEAKLFRKDSKNLKERELALPFKAGTISLSSKGYRFHDVWVIIAGWSNDNRRYRFDAEHDIFVKETLSSPAEYPEYRDLVVEEHMIPSHDGVLVPLSIIYKKGIEKTCKNPALIYGYGAYGKSITPFFSPGMLLWADKGGVLAFAHVRGGGECGDTWHTQGMKTTKPNTWKDLISCAEYLEKMGYTGRGKIAINGASAGGILVGMALCERPDLFAAVIPQVGALNPLRGEESPNGPINVPEFGTVKNREECRALIAMDPYLNIKDQVAYPATLVTTGLNDPRVIAWQPAKFAARLQQATTSKKPVLFFADDKAGHGMGNTKSKEFETLADVLSFGLWQTGHPEFQPK
ncbi:MAG: prolyl oligopeptidase family serine peptidase [Chlorobium sp.]|nr:MAG: S9 family peptidase [Chlorobium sp.]